MSFEYRNNVLFCDGISIPEIVKSHETPFFLYSEDFIRRGADVLKKAFIDKGINVSYALKANSNIYLLNCMNKLGLDVDIVSGGELFVALKAGFTGDQISFAGTGKTESDIKYALESNIAQFNVESSFELQMIQKIAKSMHLTANVLLRINPNIDAKTHPHISTGLKENKFGIAMDEVDTILHHPKRYPNINIMGLHSHIGSQILNSEPFMTLIDFMRNYLEKLKNEGIHLTHVDLGGGFGVDYTNPLQTPEENQFVLEKIGHYAKEQLSDYKLFIQPGRILVGNAGLIITKVLGEKLNSEKRFYIVDAGMTELIRPSLYSAYHAVLPLNDTHGKINADIVGPVCESTDFFSKNREIPKLHQGELVAIGSSGAYASSMSSNYNSRPFVAELIVDSKQDVKTIRRRQTYEEMSQLYII